MPDFGAPKRIRRLVVERGDLRIGVTGTNGTPPILAEKMHIQVMHGHRCINVQNGVPKTAHPPAYIRLLAGDEVTVKAIDLQQSLPANKHIAAEVE